MSSFFFVHESDKYLVTICLFIRPISIIRRGVTRVVFRQRTKRRGGGGGLIVIFKVKTSEGIIVEVPGKHKAG